MVCQLCTVGQRDGGTLPVSTPVKHFTLEHCLCHGNNRGWSWPKLYWQLWWMLGLSCANSRKLQWLHSTMKFTRQFSMKMNLILWCLLWNLTMKFTMRFNKAIELIALWFSLWSTYIYVVNLSVIICLSHVSMNFLWTLQWIYRWQPTTTNSLKFSQINVRLYLKDLYEFFNFLSINYKFSIYLDYSQWIISNFCYVKLYKI